MGFPYHATVNLAALFYRREWGGRPRWLWVALSSTTAIFKIASRRAEEIRDLIGEAFLGWLVSDGYTVYRGYERRQRCMAG